MLIPDTELTPGLQLALERESDDPEIPLAVYQTASGGIRVITGHNRDLSARERAGVTGVIAAHCVEAF